MKKLLKGTMVTIASLVAFVIIALIAMSIMSHYGGNHGLFKGKLQACKLTPNCICTEDFDNKNAEPINIQGVESATAWETLKGIVVATGGKIESDDGKYLWATYTTPIFRFVDDFEARLDEQQAVIHLRSASRVGHGDMGVNKKRVDTIIEKYQASR